MSLSFDPNYKPVGTQMFPPWDNSPFQNPKPNPVGTQMFPSWDDSLFQNPKPSPFPGPKKRCRLDPGSGSLFVGDVTGINEEEEEPKPAQPAPVQTSVFIFNKGEIGQCMYCLKVDDHYTIACSYAERVPKNAIVSPGCDIVCIHCGRYFGVDGGCYSHEREGRAILKSCQLCGRVGDHWGADCPDRDQLIKSRSARVPGMERAESHAAFAGISSLEGLSPDVVAAMRKFQDHIRQQFEARHRSQ